MHLFCPPDSGTRCSCWAPTGSGATCSRASSTACGSRSPSASSASRSASFSACCFGGLAGYYGGWVDDLMQRVIEVLRSIPHLPLWLALAAILPVNWSPMLVYFGITIILGLIDWTGLARAVRSRLLSLREEDFCVAAELMGASPRPHHLPPPDAELHEPSDRLGDAGDPRHDPRRDGALLPGPGHPRRRSPPGACCLNEAQNIKVVALYPWLMLPIVPVIIVVLAFNFLGDGLRDAADPYR